MVHLSEEQQLFLNRALAGCDILVDACIGSGKTTAIQALCDALPSDKRILYLTYNKLLKLDAKAKIHNPNAVVTNYHGYAFQMLSRAGKRCGISDLIQTFNREHPPIPHADILILDEYQDIEQELAEMLTFIKQQNPGMQIIAVGDMAQKIYDKTTLNVPQFMEGFLRPDYLPMNFTQCFRLSANHAAMLGRIWTKPIIGVNTDCVIETMSEKDVYRFLSGQNPEDILCLGSRTGAMAKTLNKLETKLPHRFNKHNVYASIRDSGDTGAEPDNHAAIFTTFDSSKGLERNICVIFDFTENYWQVRAHQPMQSYEILRNIFCVAASRGKQRVIFVEQKKQKQKEALLSEQTLSTPFDTVEKFKKVSISEMFDFKYKEDVEQCFSLLHTAPIACEDHAVIQISNNDALIDLSPCIGIYQEAMFFHHYDIEKEFAHRTSLLGDGISVTYDADAPLEQKILQLVAYDTKQRRYINQVQTPFVNEDQVAALRTRLQTEFDGTEEEQIGCGLVFKDAASDREITCSGFADVKKDGRLWELKFVSELTHEHFLQLACYLLAQNIEEGILWNTKNNTKFRVTIPNRDAFRNAVATCITKGQFKSLQSVRVNDTLALPQEEIVIGSIVYFEDSQKENENILFGKVISKLETGNLIVQKHGLVTRNGARFPIAPSDIFLERTNAFCTIRECLQQMHNERVVTALENESCTELDSLAM